MVNSSQPLLEISSPNKSSIMSYSPFLIPAFLTYVALCSLLRFRRRDAIQKKFNYMDKSSMSKMTNVDAQAILNQLAEFEFPKMYETSLQFALFKTYGIPTISSLLAATREFSDKNLAAKRYADTTVLITEFSAHPPQSERVIKALARMNYIHSVYQKSGNISNEDLLYTLSVFITEPINWIAKYEWRPMTEMEKCAVGTFWKSIGDAMEIKYKGYLSKSKWTDGLEFYDDIRDWAERYENEFMVPAQSSKKVADGLVPLLLFYVPKSLRPFATNIVCVLMGPKLRASMMYPTPPELYAHITNAIFETRKFFLRYLSLPRPGFLRVRGVVDSADPKTGRLHVTHYMSHPYYIKPGFLNRWGPSAWISWLAGGDLPGSSDKYVPEGYKFEEVGPKGMMGKGLSETKAWEEKLHTERPAGCPFAFAR